MDAIKFYYEKQADARGLNTLAATRAFDDSVDRIYDALVLKYLPSNKQAAIYEVACGPGMVMAWLKRRGYTRVIGTDISEAYIAIAKEAGLNARVADSLLELKNQPDDSLDAVIAIDFIEHLPKDVFIGFIHEVRRVLCGGGVLIIRAPNGDSPIVGRNLYNDITHYWAYTSIAFNAIFSVMGFSGVKFEDEASSPASGCHKYLAPLSWVTRKMMRTMWALATRERIDYWSSCIFVIAKK